MCTERLILQLCLIDSLAIYLNVLQSQILNSNKDIGFLYIFEVTIFQVDAGYR